MTDITKYGSLNVLIVGTYKNETYYKNETFGVDFNNIIMSDNKIFINKTLNLWCDYYLSFVEHVENNYTRIYYINDYIIFKLRTCFPTRCGSCRTDYSICDDCIYENYALIKNGNETCYPIEKYIKGYIYNNSTNLFEKCYSSCDFCSSISTNDSDHKCLSCSNEYLISYKNLGNCYKSDDTNFVTSSCSKYTINSTNECVDECPTTSPYYSFEYNSEMDNYSKTSLKPHKYIFNKKCYEECPINTISNDDNICNCKFGFYTDNNNINCFENLDENYFSNRIDILDDNNSNRISIRENISDINSYEMINNQSDNISIEIKYKDIKTNLLDSISEEKEIVDYNTIISDTNLIEKSADLASEYQTINQLIITNKIEIDEKIYDLLNKIINEKTDNNINFIENIQKLFLNDSINNILDNIVNGDKDIIISNNETIMQITSTDNQRNNKNHNISTINLGVCEEILKNSYNIAHNESLLILKIDSFKVGLKIPIIQYEVYHPENKGRLNLALCHNKIEVNIPVLIDENNLYKYEQNSMYYNDRCFINISETGKDIPLECRRKEFINNNMSLCEPGCDYIGYDYDTKIQNANVK